MNRGCVGLGVAVVALAVCGIAHAQQGVSATVTMQAQPTVAQVGDVIRLEVQAQVSGSTNVQVELPELSAFDVMSRQVSTPMQFRFGFGNQAQTIQSTTVHRLTLRARQPGTFALGPATALVDGRPFRSNSVTIQVGGAAAPDPDPSAQPPPSAADPTGFDPTAFVRTVVDTPSPYVGQQVTVTVYLYSRQPQINGLNVTQEPTTEGFWVHDLLPPQRTLEAQQQTVNGLSFQVFVLRRFAAFPLRSGPLTVGGTGVTMSSSGIFDIFAPPSAPLSRVGAPITVDVRELPDANRPPGVPHVGTLELSATLDPTQAATGDAVQLTVTARGTGMLRQLTLPDPAAPGLRVLTPEVSDQVTSPRDLVGGARTFRWLIVPEREGTYTLGPFAVPVLDPRTGTYGVARAEALRLTSAGNPVGSATPDPEPGPSLRADERALTLGPIRTRSALARSHAPLVEATWVRWAFALGPMTLLVGLAVLAARRRAQRGPARGPRQASRDARRRLSSARGHADAGRAREFYGAIAQALKEVLEAKLTRAVGSLTHAELRRSLVGRGLAEGLADRVVDELEGCDFARFSAAGVRSEEMQQCLDRARGLLDELERFVPREEVAS